MSDTEAGRGFSTWAVIRAALGVAGTASDENYEHWSARMDARAHMLADQIHAHYAVQLAQYTDALRECGIEICTEDNPPTWTFSNENDAVGFDSIADIIEYRCGIAARLSTPQPSPAPVADDWTMELANKIVTPRAPVAAPSEAGKANVAECSGHPVPGRSCSLDVGRMERGFGRYCAWCCRAMPSEVMMALPTPQPSPASGAGVSDAVCDEILEALDAIAAKAGSNEFGLPTHFIGLRDDMRAAIRTALASGAGVSDAERLDWMESRAQLMSHPSISRDALVWDVMAYADENGVLPTIREAIDASRTALASGA